MGKRKEEYEERDTLEKDDLVEKKWREMALREGRGGGEWIRGGRGGERGREDEGK